MFYTLSPRFDGRRGERKEVDIWAVCGTQTVYSFICLSCVIASQFSRRLDFIPFDSNLLNCLVSFLFLWF